MYKINEISVEHHSYCNRTCPWCSNSVFPRDKYEELNEDSFIKMLTSIADNRRYFADRLVLSCCRYNEPFFNIELANKRNALIRKILPDVKIQGNTNGDFLTKEKLLSMDMDKLNILDYDMKGVEECKKIMEDLGITYMGMDPKNNNRIMGRHPNIKSITYRADFFETAKLQDRGGVLDTVSVTLNGEEKVLIEKIKRDFPCTMVLTTASVDYNGDVFLCYNMRTDNKAHKKFCVGNINKKDFFKIVSGTTANKVRKLVKGEDNFPKECEYCTNRRKV